MNLGFGFREGFARVTDAISNAASLATAVKNGTLSIADFLKLANVPSGGMLPTVFVSDVIDLAAAPGTTTPWGGNWPTLPGFKLIWTGCRPVITNLVATSFGVQPAISVGNNGTFDNILATVAPVSLANLTAFLAVGNGGPYYASAFPTIAGGVNGKTPDLATIPSIKLQTQATGVAVTQCKMRLLLSGLVSTLFPTI